MPYTGYREGRYYEAGDASEAQVCLSIIGSMAFLAVAMIAFLSCVL